MAITILRKTAGLHKLVNLVENAAVYHAYGGENGIVSGYADELKITLEEENLVHISRGRVIFQGWEVDIDECRILLDDVTPGFGGILLHIETGNQTAELLQYRNPAAPPALSSGNLLANTPNIGMMVSSGELLLCSYQLGPFVNSKIENFQTHLNIVYPAYEKLKRLGFSEEL